MGVMDVVFGESTGRLRRPISLEQLQSSVDEARTNLCNRGELLHAESLLRHWDENEKKVSSGPSSRSSLEWPVVNVELAQAQLVQLKRAEVSAWFKGAPFEELQRGDIEEWMACSFYSRSAKEVCMLGHGKELGELANEVFEKCECSMREGGSMNAPMRVTMDPIPWKHRPFLFYAVTDLSVKGLTFVAMRCLGFHHYNSGSLGYWYRPGVGAARVFCHGVGLGVLPYVELLRRLSHGSQPLFAIELEAIAMRIQQAVPSHTEVAGNIRDMLHAWGFASAHFIGHSFGTVVLGWVVKCHPDLVRCGSFLDPVVFMLCNPMLCFNFMYKTPRNGVDKLMRFFVSSEFYMANMLSRHFVWHECVLWEDDVVFPEGTLILLSGDDPLVPSHEVRRYLQNTNAEASVFFLDGAYHGEFLFRPNLLTEVVSKLA